MTKTDLRMGPFLRPTSKIFATTGAFAWECYVNAASVWLWINGPVLPEQAGFAVNKPSRVMGCTERMESPFERVSHAVYVWPTGLPPAPYPLDQIRAACRRLEPLIEQLELGRNEYLSATPDQITLWNRKPTREVLRRRVQLLRRHVEGAATASR